MGVCVFLYCVRSVLSLYISSTHARFLLTCIFSGYRAKVRNESTQSQCRGLGERERARGSTSKQKHRDTKKISLEGDLAVKRQKYAHVLTNVSIGMCAVQLMLKGSIVVVGQLC